MQAEAAAQIQCEGSKGKSFPARGSPAPGSREWLKGKDEVTLPSREAHALGFGKLRIDAVWGEAVSRPGPSVIRDGVRRHPRGPPSGNQDSHVSFVLLPLVLADGEAQGLKIGGEGPAW